jgi:hypothetical protein
LATDLEHSFFLGFLQEDVVLLAQRPGDDHYTVLAGAVAFPAHWWVGPALGEGTGWDGLGRSSCSPPAHTSACSARPRTCTPPARLSTSRYSGCPVCSQVAAFWLPPYRPPALPLTLPTRSIREKLGQQLPQVRHHVV